MIIDCISDLHGFYPKLDGGDLLIIAGDLTAHDFGEEYLRFNAWLSMQRYEKKIVIAGNHDNLCQNGIKLNISDKYEELTLIDSVPVLADRAEYLCDSGTEFEDLKIWGSPWTPWFEGVNPRCTAFMLPENKLENKFSMIPNDINILITHGPPWATLDLVKQISFTEEVEFTGSKSLVKSFERINPFLHVFGHIHASYGAINKPIMNLNKRNMCTFVNASHVNERYEPVNKPIRIEI